MGRLPGRVRVGCRVWFRKKLWGGFELGLVFRLRVTVRVRFRVMVPF